jgi:uncharacterized membrane protein
MNFLRSFAVPILLLACVSVARSQSTSNVTQAQLTFTTIDVPGAGVTGVYGINSAGDMVGYYGTDTNDPHKHGFLLKAGLFTYLDYPGAYATFAYGINNSGLVVGSAEVKSGTAAVGFTYNNSTFVAFRDGSDTVTIPYGINNTASLVGGAGTIYTTKGFKMRAGSFSGINGPGQYIYVFGSGINNFGSVVGWADNDGFVCRNGTCQITDVQGANQTANRGINDGGVIVGWYSISGCLGCGFALKNGKYLSFTYPGASATYATGINASGQIIGQYTFDFQSYHGFITSPITSADFQ